MMGEEERARPPRRSSLLLWPIHYLLHWVIKAAVLVAMGIRAALAPKPVRYGLLGLVVVAGVGWTVVAGSFKGTGEVAGVRSAEVISTAAPQSLPPAPVVERYLKAQADYNANGMWDSISDDLKQQMATANASPRQLQVELDAARQQGRRYSGATYVGGVPMSEGRSVYFYVLIVATPRGSVEVPYIYVVGGDGKIVSIQ